MEEILLWFLMGKNFIIYLLIFSGIIAVLVVFKNDKFKLKFSSQNLVKEKEINKLGSNLVVGKEKELVKSLFKIKISDILILIFVVPLLFWGSELLIGALIKRNDIFLSLFMGLLVFIVAFLLAKKIIKLCFEKIILAKRSTLIYKIEVFKCESQIRYTSDPDWLSHIYYYICVKNKNNIEIKKWYEVNENTFNEENLFLYYFKILNKNHIILVPKKIIEEKLNISQ